MWITQTSDPPMPPLAPQSTKDCVALLLEAETL